MSVPTALTSWMTPERFTVWGAAGQARLTEGHALRALAWDTAATPPKLCVIEASLGDDSSSEDHPDPQSGDNAHDDDVEESETPSGDFSAEEPTEGGASETTETKTTDETGPDMEEPQSDQSQASPEGSDQGTDAERALALGDLSLSADRLELTLGEGNSDPGDTSDVMAVLEQRRNRRISHHHVRGRAGVEALSLQRGRKFRETAAVEGVTVSLVPTVQRAARRHGASGAEGQLRVQDSDVRGMQRRRLAGAHTVVLVDGSSSLGQAGLSATSRAVDHAVGQVASRRGVVSVVIAAGSAARTLVQRSTSPARARRALHRVPAGGGTPLSHGVDLALGLLEADDPGQRRLLIITDGHPTVGLSGAYTQFDDAWAELSQLLEHAVDYCEDVSVLPVGLFSDRVLTRHMAPFRAAGVRVGSLLL